MNLCSILCRSVSSTFSLLSVLRDYVKIWFQGKLVVRWLVQKQPFLPFLTQPKSSNNYFLEKHLSLERQKWYYYQFCDFRHFKLYPIALNFYSGVCATTSFCFKSIHHVQYQKTIDTACFFICFHNIELNLAHILPQDHTHFGSFCCFPMKHVRGFN